MSGHSHWAGIRHHKGINDAKRAALFTKAGRDVTLAAQKGGDPETNFRLRLAIEAARAVNMPKDNIERAIKKGTGELSEGARLEEIMYEGFGPGHVAILIETATDNKNRTVSELKSLLLKNAGKMGASGSVSFLFKRVGELVFPLASYDREALELAAIEANALDFVVAQPNLVLYTESNALESIRQRMLQSGFSSISVRLAYLPRESVELEREGAQAFVSFLEKVEDHPDVQTVWDNRNTATIR